MDELELVHLKVSLIKIIEHYFFKLKKFTDESAKKLCDNKQIFLFLGFVLFQKWKDDKYEKIRANSVFLGENAW